MVCPMCITAALVNTAPILAASIGGTAATKYIIDKRRPTIIRPPPSMASFEEYADEKPAKVMQLVSKPSFPIDETSQATKPEKVKKEWYVNPFEVMD